MDIEDTGVGEGFIDDPFYVGATFTGKGYRALPLGVGAIKSNLVVRNREFLYNPKQAILWGERYYPEGFAVIEYSIPKDVEVREDEYYFWLFPRRVVRGRVILRRGRGYSKARFPKGYQGIIQELSEEELKSFKWDKWGD